MLFKFVCAIRENINIAETEKSMIHKDIRYSMSAFQD